MRVVRSLRRNRPRKRHGPWLSPVWRRQVLFGLIVGLVASGLTTVASAQGYLQLLHNHALAVLFWWTDSSPSPHIVIAAVDDAVLTRLRAPKQIPRDYLARVVRGATRGGARAIGLVVPNLATSSAGPDQALVDAISEAEAAGIPVVTAVTSVDDPASGVRLPAESRVGRLAVARTDEGADRRGVIRHFRTAVPVGGAHLPTFGLSLLRAAARHTAPAADGRGVEYEVDALYWTPRMSWVTPSVAPLTVTPGKWHTINYVGTAGSFSTISSDVLSVLATDPRSPGRRAVAGRLVLIGPTDTESGETYATPRGAMTGVEIQANVAHTLLTRSWGTPATWLAAVVAQGLLCLGTAMLVASLHPLEAVLAGLIVVAGGLVPLSYLVYGTGDRWVDFAIPAVVVFFQIRALDRLEQRRLHVSFARYVSPEVVRRVLATKEATLRAEQREVTILFCDLRDSTAIGEKLAMTEFMRLLNDYFAVVTEAVFRNGGMINKFIGDGILAVYNAPVDVPDHADAAVKTALQIHDDMGQINRRWSDWLAVRLSVGVGIHSGTVVSGNVGSARRLEYTIIGDPVNVAARVESVTKELGATILITKETRARLREHYPLKSLGPVPLRGRSEPIELFQIM